MTKNTKSPAPAIDRASNDLFDCAATLRESSVWLGALFSAIHRIAHRADDMSMDELSTGDRSDVATLATIGSYLADNSWSSAADFKAKAESIKAPVAA